ncbi:lytic transglycosylase domain-containing protein [Methylocapsa sp. S129]|uniref:lytic transglycosylase domain-containing protein n=1 Tax=Methylocapsa sp. S129 TaxID=1641869 RepID=UPI00131DE24E|nr:lytic transglycosylase domain-containing protein [Methylocapsa sp. S129]
MVGGRVSLSLIVAAALCWAAASQERARNGAPAKSRPILAKLDFTPVSRIGGEQEPAPRIDLAPAPIAAPVLPDAGLSPMLAAAALYQKGDLAGGDALAKALDDPLQRAALEWIALKSSPRADYARLTTFQTAHPEWPASTWIRYRQEAALYNDRAHPELTVAVFAQEPPRTPVGKLALARIESAGGRLNQATALVRSIWRDDDFDGWTEGALLSEFGALLTSADHKYRAERLLYQEKIGAALRVAALAGSEELALAKIWAGAIGKPLTDAAWDALPAAMKSQPGLLYVRIQTLRRTDRVLEAAALIRSAPRGAAIDGDRWWDERRMVARRLLDGGLIKDAYALCAQHSAVSIPSRIDAEFHAGWIALRFLGDAQAGADHFAAAAAIAQTPLAIARTAYWQGRAAEQAQRADEARNFYQRAAAYPIAYYGQLAADKLHIPALTLRAPASVAVGEARNEATRIVELLYAAKLDGFARSLAFEAARSYRDEAQLAALAAIAAARLDGPASVEIGKQATERGFALDESAFPTFGVPGFAPLTNSAELAAVYSVARQESEFAGGAASGAGAKGLMQILPSTARDTARRMGIPFDAARLTADPAYNTQLGAAYLGQLLNDEGGSYVLALAAYNAGGGRVQQWIEAHGDPRAANVDPVDWVESIPFDETRDYVQRVSENLQVYRVRLSALAKAPVEPQTGRVARADF